MPQRIVTRGFGSSANPTTRGFLGPPTGPASTSAIYRNLLNNLYGQGFRFANAPHGRADLVEVIGGQVYHVNALEFRQPEVYESGKSQTFSGVIRFRPLGVPSAVKK